MVFTEKELGAVVGVLANEIETVIYNARSPAFCTDTGEISYPEIDWRKIAAAAARIEELALSKFS